MTNITNIDSASIAAVVTVPVVFLAILPSIAEMKACADPKTALVMHDAQVWAFAVCAFVGLALSIATASPVPALLSVVAATAHVGASHYLITRMDNE